MTILSEMKNKFNVFDLKSAKSSRRFVSRDFLTRTPRAFIKLIELELLRTVRTTGNTREYFLWRFFVRIILGREPRGRVPSRYDSNFDDIVSHTRVCVRRANPIMVYSKEFPEQTDCMLGRHDTRIFQDFLLQKPSD